MLEVVAQLPKNLVSKKRSVEKFTTSKDSLQWMTYDAAANVDSDEVIREYLDNGTMVSRPNPKLRKTTNLKWPRTLEVAYAIEK